MRNSQLTFVPSASAKPPPTSRTTFHGMAAWNSPQEIMASWWREIKKILKNIPLTSLQIETVPVHKKHANQLGQLQRSRSNVQNIPDYSFIIMVVTPSCSGVRSIVHMCVCTEVVNHIFWRVRRQERWRRGGPAAEPRWHQWCSRSDCTRQEQEELIYWQLSVQLQQVQDTDQRNVRKHLVTVGFLSSRRKQWELVAATPVN